MRSLSRLGHINSPPTRETEPEEGGNRPPRSYVSGDGEQLQRAGTGDAACG
jgi:hypothetical protein